MAVTHRDLAGEDRRVIDGGQTIWLDGIATQLGFGRLAAMLPVGVSPAMLFVTTVVFFDTVLIEFIRFLTGGPVTFLRNPFVLLGEGGGALLITVYGIRRLSAKYANARTRLQVENRLDPTEAARFEILGSNRLRWAGWVLGAGIQIFQAAFILGPAEIYRVDGVVGLLGNFVFIPFVYIPVVVDFAVTYFAIQVLLPRHIKNSDLRLDFLDPENMGGLRPIGELLKLSYYYFVLLYVSVAIWMYGPELYPELFYSPFDPGILVNALFTISWVASAVVLTYGIFTLHVFMSREKKRELQRLDRKVKERVEEPWDVQNFKIPDENEYQEIRKRMEYVTATKEYPVTFAAWSHLLLSILIPKAIQTVLNLA